MENIAKSKILASCIEKQKSLIKDFSGRLNDLRDETNQSLSDIPSQSELTVASTVEVMSRLEAELAFVEDELEDLNKIDASSICSIVQFGAVVCTSKMNFFVSVSIENIEIEGNGFFGISIKAPIYQAMKGLKKGDSFEFRGISYNIIDLY